MPKHHIIDFNTFNAQKQTYSSSKSRRLSQKPTAIKLTTADEKSLKEFYDDFLLKTANKKQHWIRGTDSKLIQSKQESYSSFSFVNLQRLNYSASKKPDHQIKAFSQQDVIYMGQDQKGYDCFYVVGEYIAQGAFGSVNASHYLLKAKKTSRTFLSDKLDVKIYPTNDVLKIIGPNEKIDDLIEEAKINHQQTGGAGLVELADGRKIMLMKRLPGKDLSKFEFEKLSFVEVLRMMQSAVSEIDDLHNKAKFKNRTVHGDIKLANFVGTKQGVRATDYGLSTQGGKQGVQGGTPLYIDKRVFEQGVNKRSDISALALVLAEMLVKWAGNSTDDLVSPRLDYWNKFRRCDSEYYAIQHDFSPLLKLAPKLPRTIDPKILNDIVEFLNLMQSQDNTNQPTIDEVVKFFAGINIRLIQYKTHQEELQKSTEQLNKLVRTLSANQKTEISSENRDKFITHTETKTHTYITNQALKNNNSFSTYDPYHTDALKAKNLRIAQLSQQISKQGINKDDNRLQQDVEKIVTDIKQGNHNYNLETLETFVKHLSARQQQFTDYKNEAKKLNTYQQQLHKLSKNLTKAKDSDLAARVNCLIADTQSSEVDCNNIKSLLDWSAKQDNQRDNQPLDLQFPTAEIQTTTNNISTILAQEERLKDILAKLNNNDVADKTNSSGFKDLVRILTDDKLSVFEKATKYEHVCKNKTKKSWSNWYSRSKVFGKGRSEKMEKLYQAGASMADEQKTTAKDPLAIDALDDIAKSMAKQPNSFLHPS